MKTINAYQLQKLHFPVDDYLYIVQTWRSVDNGSSFAYCGESKYFRTEAEAAAYKAEQGQQEPAAGNNYKICFINGHNLKYTEI